MKRASAITVVRSCTGLAGNKNPKRKKNKKRKRSQFQFYFFSEIGNSNVGGPVNQLIKKNGLNFFFYYFLKVLLTMPLRVFAGVSVRALA
jgi:hypothetical protein